MSGTSGERQPLKADHKTGSSSPTAYATVGGGTAAAGRVAAPVPTKWSRLRCLLGSGPMRLFLDWGGLVAFYAIQPNNFTAAVVVALCICTGAVLLTHLRAHLDPGVISPKVMDVGFVVTFALFSILCWLLPSSAQFLSLWANFFMNLAFFLIVLVGICLGRPFVMPYAIESGLPRALASEPYMVAVLTDMTWPWCYCFWMMALVCAVAPLYQCATVGCIAIAPPTRAFDELNLWFTYVLQAAILAFYMTRAAADGINRRKEYEATTAALARPADVWESTYGRIKLSSASVRVIRDDRLEEPETVAAESARAGRTLGRAMARDPIVLKWPGFGTIADDAERARWIAPFFSGWLRLLRRYGYCFEAGDGAAFCFCIPCWGENGAKEHERAMGQAAREVLLAEHPEENGVDPDGHFRMPAPEVFFLAKLSASVIGKRPHLYVALLGSDPEQQRQGHGGAALEAACDAADARGVPVVLETCSAANVRFYSRRDFVVKKSMRVAGCDHPWVVMVREQHGLTADREKIADLTPTTSPLTTP